MTEEWPAKTYHKALVAPGTFVWGDILGGVVISQGEYNALKAQGVEYLIVSKDGSIVGYGYENNPDDKKGSL